MQTAKSASTLAEVKHAKILFAFHCSTTLTVLRCAYGHDHRYSRTDIIYRRLIWPVFNLDQFYFF